jgi:type III restriction enzyme
MTLNEVPKPIINIPYREPACHWRIEKGEPPELVEGRREACYYYRPPQRQTIESHADDIGTRYPLMLANDLRKRVKAWHEAGCPGVTSMTDELLKYWSRDEREGKTKLFFCQREAAETIIFLKEARADFLQGLEIPRDEPGSESQNNGYTGFLRHACKMATGSGKTTVMGMLAAWSILNMVANRSDSRFSDVVLVVCPNVTIRERLQELDPNSEANLYRSRDLVPTHLMSDMRQGHVIITNWHVLEAQVKYFESDTALVDRVLRDVKGKTNILVFNDESHHAYRVRQLDNEGELEEEDDEFADIEQREATVWVEGLDKINRIRGINFCLDLSATPFYLERGNDPGRPFPWVVSDFGLIDAIESGIVKIPQLPIQDTTGSEIPAYFNVWKWILEKKLTSAEKGGRRGQVKPEAVLKWARTPIAQLAGLWRQTFYEWQEDAEAGRRSPVPPVFIIVCKNTRLAKVVYEWIAECKSETAPPIEEFRNRDGKEYTVRVDSKVVEEMESGAAKNDESQKLRFVLDTIGKIEWPGGKPPQEYFTLVERLNRKAADEGETILDPSIPPGRDVRCIISVSMLTEGWDATTVTYIVGLRPFKSQLLCEQVVGRGLRRSRYDVLNCENVDDIPEEVAKVYGVPFELILLKTNPKTADPPPKIHHVKAISPQKDALEIRFPRVEGYNFRVKNRITVDWERIPTLPLDPANIPNEVRVKGLSSDQGGRLSLLGPGRTYEVTLTECRKTKRLGELEFEMARTLTQKYAGSDVCDIPAQALFPQALVIVRMFLSKKVKPAGTTDIRDVFLDPYYGWAVETLVEAIVPDVADGEMPELPRYETNREPGSTREVDFWTSRIVWECQRSHLNYMVADTEKWEQSTAYYLDRNESVLSFAKNFNMGFAIPYLHNGEKRDYVPDFLVRLQWKGKEVGNLILEVKGHDPLEGTKKAAALRWVNAVNNDGRYGLWDYRIVHDPTMLDEVIKFSAQYLENPGERQWTK